MTSLHRHRSVSVLLALLCAALAGCAALAPPGRPAPATAPAPAAPAAPGLPAPSAAMPVALLAGSWFSPPAEYPGICLTLAADGTLAFAGGFAFFNPGHWRYDAGTAELRLELGGSAALPPAQARPHGQAAARSGSLLRVEAGQRALVYRMTADTEAIDLGGFVFYRKLACQGG